MMAVLCVLSSHCHIFHLPLLLYGNTKVGADSGGEWLLCVVWNINGVYIEVHMM